MLYTPINFYKQMTKFELGIGLCVDLCVMSETFTLLIYLLSISVSFAVCYLNFSLVFMSHLRSVFINDNNLA